MEASADMNLNANVNQVIHLKFDLVRCLTVNYQDFGDQNARTMHAPETRV